MLKLVFMKGVRVLIDVLPKAVVVQQVVLKLLEVCRVLIKITVV